ncbi:MAG: bifunctional DNA-formamidopyrimidine glycosylase/DNA-(apurinic or apyrimidinic site) lyase [Gammaproteobacteria bacterium]|nr:bifunctional DNA-formamidopyrimidine glycosylase/DNA-(apurinic or apyrimidinic site) lyase [Gammaproteobacteria bacterium]
MPELPEVETTRRGLAPYVEGHKLVAFSIHERRLRWPVDIPEDLLGQAVRRLRRRGKYLLAEFDGGALILHLGMSGSLRFVPRGSELLTHDHVELDFGTEQVLRLNDPRRFGCVLWQQGEVESHPLLASLGPEPLENEFSGDQLFKRSRGRRVAVKIFLMDAKVVTGVGNIYANESLFLAGVRPTRKSGSIPRHQWEHVARAVRKVLADSISLGGTTLRDFINPEGRPGYFRQQLRVYDRESEPCIQCGTPLIAVVLGGRSTFYCPACQPAKGFGPVSCRSC